MGDIGHEVAIVAGQLFSGLDIAVRPTVADVAEVDIGLARMLHTFTHGGLVRERAARHGR